MVQKALGVAVGILQSTGASVSFMSDKNVNHDHISNPCNFFSFFFLFHFGNACGWLCLPITTNNFAHVVGFGLYKNNFEPVDKNCTYEWFMNNRIMERPMLIKFPQLYSC